MVEKSEMEILRGSTVKSVSKSKHQLPPLEISLRKALRKRIRIHQLRLWENNVWGPPIAKRSTTFRTQRAQIHHEDLEWSAKFKSKIATSKTNCHCWLNCIHFKALKIAKERITVSKTFSKHGSKCQLNSKRQVPTKK